MQLANCHVRLGGDITNEIFKGRVTPAEVAVLRALHGQDAVAKLQPLGQDKRPHAGEFERLKADYGEKVVGAVFPGAFPQLPVNFKDIGVDLHADAANDKPSGRRGAKAAGTQQPADGGDAQDDEAGEAGEQE